MTAGPGPDGGCWVPGCKGGHDRFVHPHHTCRCPSAFRSAAGQVWACPCGRRFRCTHGKIAADKGWELLDE